MYRKEPTLGRNIHFRNTGWLSVEGTGGNSRLETKWDSRWDSREDLRWDSSWDSRWDSKYFVGLRSGIPRQRFRGLTIRDVVVGLGLKRRQLVVVVDRITAERIQESGTIHWLMDWLIVLLKKVMMPHQQFTITAEPTSSYIVINRFSVAVGLNFVPFAFIFLLFYLCYNELLISCTNYLYETEGS